MASIAPFEPDWSAAYPSPTDASEAAEHWRTVTAELAAAGTLADANGHTVRRLVEFRVQYEKAAKHVAEHGSILTAKRAKVGQWNPFWSAMQQADARIVILESKLGLDPVSRGKTTKVARGKKTARAADQYLKAASE
ncbi:P27 family phage terminase small subunit [Mesorhizobium sp.]|uniref:P27 family phage terminase small subunit n=1 Tax=Mesorhizobium sp. TaxID=1871066 RepID=UPI0012156887|nr:P27 family phage terminase small subunit [Mesorhizobium sp.]TIN10395.1 MAG: P27 family phage terminase small subunit [Mesorhizobium sp.]